MVEIISEIVQIDVHDPVAAMVVYRKDGKYYDSNKFYIELHKIKEDGTFAEGKPLSRQTISKLSDILIGTVDKEKGIHGIIPERLIWCNPLQGKFIWYNPPAKRYVEFQEHKDETGKETNLESGDYHMPGVVFATDGSQLNAWAYKGKKPNDKTKLLHGPFYNIYESGRLCLGTASKKFRDEMTFENVLSHWEGMFWNSINSHPIYWPKHPDKKYEAGIQEVISKFKDEPFDTAWLKPTGKLLKHLYNGEF